MNVKLESSWKAALSKEFSKTYFNELTNFVRHSYQKTKVYPPANLIFNALDSCPLTKTNVVILVQTLPWTWQAHGLSFSVPEGFHTLHHWSIYLMNLKRMLKVYPKWIFKFMGITGSVTKCYISNCCKSAGVIKIRVGSNLLMLLLM